MNRQLSIDAETAHNFAVVPMLLGGMAGEKNETGEVFGTIHVEREDGLPPSQDDVDDLLEFGRQMAAAAHQSELVHALLAALDHDPEAVVIVDDDRCVRFVNQPAAQRLGLPKNWHESHPAVRLDSIKHSELIADFDEVLDSNKPKVRHVISTPKEVPLREVLLYAPLPNWRRDDAQPDIGHPAIGAVLQLRDLTPIHRVALALEHVAKSATDSESIIVAVLRCVANLGYPSVRLYRIDPQNQDILVSVRALGLEPTDAERFNSGFYRMDRSNPLGKDTWRCLESGEPQIHQWDPERADVPLEPSQSGLARINVRLPGFKLPWRQHGAVWIELPFLANGRPIGKLSIDCGDGGECRLTPEDFELLRLFSALLGALLDGLDRKEQWTREAADKAMATCAHNIRTKLAALDGFAEKYRAAAPDNTEVEQLNRLYQPAVAGSFRQVTRIKDTFINLHLQRSPVPVRRLVEDTFEGKFGAERKAGRVKWTIHCAQEIEFSLDADRFRNALEEMIENSREMLAPNQTLELRLEAQVESRGDRQWLCVQLYDNGPGISTEKRDRVFEPFFSERPYGKRSTGLGLNFVRRVVEAHGGKIWITGEEGKGAQFAIEIPDVNQLPIS